MASGHRATRVVIAAMLGNLVIAAAKFTAAAFTGSVLFGLGGGLSLYEGITHLKHPVERGDPLWNSVVLAVAFAAESASLSVALREFRRRWVATPLWSGFRASKDPRIFVPLAEDVAALLGLSVALLGVLLARRLAMPVCDALSSIVIGLILGAVALILAGETRGLLVGEPADPRILRRIRGPAAEDPAVRGVRQALTIHASPDQIFLNLTVYFRRDQTVGQVAAAVERLKRRVKDIDPRITRVFVEVESQPD